MATMVFQQIANTGFQQIANMGLSVLLLDICDGIYGFELVQIILMATQ